MKFKELKQQIKELQDKLNMANRTVCMQMGEAKYLKDRVEHLVECVVASEKRLLEKDVIIEYLEGKAK